MGRERVAGTPRRKAGLVHQQLRWGLKRRYPPESQGYGA